MKNKFSLLPFIFAGLIFSGVGRAVPPDQKKLPIYLTAEEQKSRHLRDEPPMTAPPPAGKIHSLAEWEESDAVMTLWPNASLLKELAERGQVKLFADARSDQNWWSEFLAKHQISPEKFSYFLTPTNSIWIRDYGPWFILDGNHQPGIVKIKYNRPRPLDNEVTYAIADELGVPYYEPGLVHTGGNYYNDGLNNAFSSTLVYAENRSLSRDTVHQRMQDFLGIDRYTTSPLAPKITIEHIDTFGKLVSPDTWVFSEFPEDSRYRRDSENLVRILSTLKSPYGTPYKIHRLKMISRDQRENYRAYINSFISNHTLYFPKYGDVQDDGAAAVYQKALPGYEVLGVDAMGTNWGDSVHCRNRNLLRLKTLFIFPSIDHLPTKAQEPTRVRAEIIPSPGAKIVGKPRLVWNRNGQRQPDRVMELTSGVTYEGDLPPVASGSQVSFSVLAHDSAGVEKRAPLFAPKMSIDFKVAY